MIFSHLPGFHAVLPSFPTLCEHLGQEQLSYSTAIQAAFPSLLQLHPEVCGDSSLALGTCMCRVCVMGQHLQLWWAPGTPWEGNGGQGGSCGKERCVTSKCCVPTGKWVKATPQVQVSRCCSLRMEELVVCNSRGHCKAGKAGTQSSHAVCPAVVPAAETAQPGHMFR